MGLTIVEWVMELEERLDVEITEDDLEGMETLGDMHRYLHGKLGRTWPCPNVAVHARLRRAYGEAFGTPREALRTRRRTDELLPKGYPPDNWQRLGKALGQKPPVLQRPLWIVWGIVLSVLAAFVLGAHTAWAECGAGCFGAGVAGLLTALFAGYLAHDVTTPLATVIPASCSTVGGMVLALRGVGPKAREWSEEELWDLMEETFRREFRPPDHVDLTKDTPLADFA